MRTLFAAFLTALVLGLGAIFGGLAGAADFQGPDEFGVIGTWQSREDKPGPGTSTVRYDSTIQFTLGGKYLIERKVTLDGQVLSHFKDSGRFRYTPTGKLGGDLEVVMDKGVGPFPPRGKVGQVHWLSPDEWIYIQGNHRLAYRRVKM
jgi:hypothetical protein